MNNQIQILSLNDVAKLTSLSRTAINRHRDAGKFPKPVALGEQRIGFLKSEVIGWIEARVAARDAKAAA